MFDIGVKLTTVCPEHEQWQDRNSANVLAVSDLYSWLEEDAEHEAEESRTNGMVERSGQSSDKTLVERDLNVEGTRHAAKR